MASNGRINTDSVFESLLGTSRKEIVHQEMPEEKKEYIEKESKVGRKAKSEQEKTIQMSVYPTKQQAKQLKMQAAEGEKEIDKSALARTGFDIVLTLSNEEYNEMKQCALEKRISVGKVVQQALQIYFKKENR